MDSQRPFTVHHLPFTLGILLPLLNNCIMSQFSDFNFSGHKAVVRVDFNVPLNDKFEITDDTLLHRPR